MASATTALNTLPVASDQVQGGSVSLQSLQAFFHLGEGSGTVATDSSPAGNNGTIGSGCTWVQGPETKVLMFNNNGSYVDLPGNDVNFGGLYAMAFTAWFSPTSATQGYLVYKQNQFYVQVNADGSIVFALYIGGAWVTLTAPAGSAALNGRLFGAFIYDGANMYIYFNGPVLAQQAQTGAIGNGTNDTYLGAETASLGGFAGVLSEVMFFGRALSPQEVYSLYFFPLTQFIAKSGSVGPAPPPPFYGYQIADINNGWIEIIEQLCVSDTAAQVESAQPLESSYFDNNPPVMPGDNGHPVESMTKVNS
jgi:hypothetical protein